MTRRRLTSERAFLAVALVVLVVGLVGSVWAVNPGAATDQPQIDDVSETYAAIEGLSANRTTTIERNGTVTSRAVYDLQSRPGTDERRLSLQSDAQRRYDLRVSNGSTLWLYDREDNHVTAIPAGDGQTPPGEGERIERLFARLNASEGTQSDAPPTVEPLPVVPQSETDRPDVGGAEFTVSYLGTESVDGRSAYVLQLAPKGGNGSVAYEQTLWVDTERYYPLKQRTAWTDGGERTVVTTTHANVTFDPGLDDKRFTFDPPPDATVERPDTPETRTYQRVSDLKASTDVSIPDPDPPASFSLTYATATEGRVHGVALRYSNETSWISVAKYNFTYERQGGDEAVTIGGQNATIAYGATTSLSWSCEDYRYTVRGSGVSTDVLVEVGRSIACP